MPWIIALQKRSGGSLEYNPFAPRCAVLQQEIAALEAPHAKRLASIGWYDDFNIEAASAQFNLLSRKSDALRLQRDQISLKSIRVDREIERLDALTAFSFDPREWFSDERTENKRLLAAQRALKAQQRKQRDAINEQLKTNRAALEAIDEERDRYRQFDQLREAAICEGDGARLAQLRSTLQQVLAEKKRLDAKLLEPLASLAEHHRQEKVLVTALSQAADLEKKLSNASNSYDRHLVHEKCTKLFNEGSPGRVLRQKQSELEGVRRTIKKLDARARSIVRRDTRVVRTVVIDGNNLCYEQHSGKQQAIGLGALQAAVKQLAQDYQVVVVFDAGICSLLRMTSQDITARLRHLAEIHIVPCENDADETILDAAGDPYTYVLSNDKFRDFPDKPVVRGGRLVTHSIVNRRIIVHDFDINEHFAAA